MAMPDPGAAAPGEDSPYIRGDKPIVFEGFTTLNTDASRPGIENDQMAICDGFMPLGRNNLRTLWGIGPPIYSLEVVLAGVEITTPPVSVTISTLAGLPSTYRYALFSTWVYLPDDGSGTHGVEFFCGGGAGVSFVIINDQSSPRQIAVALTDVSDNPIVFAEYELMTWTHWVNILISADSVGNVLQVYANDTPLTPTSITWSSTNLIGNNGGPWVIDATISGAP